MGTTHRTGWLALGGAFGAGIAAVVVSALAGFVNSGSAASQAVPVNTKPPKISGSPVEGQSLHGDRGRWDHNPDSYAYSWYRCDKTGSHCATVSGQTTRDYRLTSADLGNTIRFRVVATNQSGSAAAASAPTAVIQKTPPPPPRVATAARRAATRTRWRTSRARPT